MRLLRTLAVCVVPLALPAAALGADAVASGNGGNVALGKNWGPYETFGGRSFRWVGNDAEIVVRDARGSAVVTIACEGGPSLGQPSFFLRALDASRRQVDHVKCAGAGNAVQFFLPANGAESRYVLHVDGGGRAAGSDKRILNFRVFSLDGGGNAPAGGDIVDARNGVRLGNGWYGPEHFSGQTFRWLNGSDGRFFVTSNRELETKLRLLVATGPSIGTRDTTVTVHDASGKSLGSTKIADPKNHTIEVAVHLKPGENEFGISVQTQNKPVPHDPRHLNLRVFSIAALR